MPQRRRWLKRHQAPSAAKFWRSSRYRVARLWQAPTSSFEKFRLMCLPNQSQPTQVKPCQNLSDDQKYNQKTHTLARASTHTHTRILDFWRLLAGIFSQWRVQLCSRLIPVAHPSKKAVPCKHHAPELSNPRTTRRHTFSACIHDFLPPASCPLPFLVSGFRISGDRKLRASDRPKKTHAHGPSPPACDPGGAAGGSGGRSARRLWRPPPCPGPKVPWRSETPSPELALLPRMRIVRTIIQSGGLGTSTFLKCVSCLWGKVDATGSQQGHITSMFSLRLTV